MNDKLTQAYQVQVVAGHQKLLEMAEEHIKAVTAEMRRWSFFIYALEEGRKLITNPDNWAQKEYKRVPKKYFPDLDESTAFDGFVANAPWQNAGTKIPNSECKFCALGAMLQVTVDKAQLQEDLTADQRTVLTAGVWEFIFILEKQALRKGYVLPSGRTYKGAHIAHFNDNSSHEDVLEFFDSQIKEQKEELRKAYELHYITHQQTGFDLVFPSYIEIIQDPMIPSLS